MLVSLDECDATSIRQFTAIRASAAVDSRQPTGWTKTRLAPSHVPHSRAVSRRAYY
jgi:hypothetical protein